MAEFNNLLDQSMILDRQDLTSTEKLVAVVILSFRNSQNGRCNPPVASKTPGKVSICTRTGLSRACVLNAIQSLEKKNVFVIQREVGQKSNFIFQGVYEVDTGVNVVDTMRGVHDVDMGVYEVDTGGIRGRPEGSTSYTHNKEGTKNKQRINKEDRGAPSSSLTPKPVKDKSRGTSFTLETLPDDWKDAVEKLAPDLDAEKLFDEFSDYWKAVPGEKGRKKDWLATFRNHIRNLPDWKRKNFRKTNSYREPETREPDFSKIDYGESGLLSDFKF